MLYNIIIICIIITQICKVQVKQIKYMYHKWDCSSGQMMWTGMNSINVYLKYYNILVNCFNSFIRSIYLSITINSISLKIRLAPYDNNNKIHKKAEECWHLLFLLKLLDMMENINNISNSSWSFFNLRRQVNACHRNNLATHYSYISTTWQ